MKKLLLVITLLLVLFMGACESAPQDTELQDRVTVLEGQVDELEQILIDLEFIEGLNGQREYYLPQTNETSMFNFQSVSANEVELLGTELDKSKAPSYVLDINEEYIAFKDVVQLLVDKYYSDEVTIDTALIGFQIKMVLTVGDVSQEELMAQTILLINELSLYDFYILGGSELYIQFVGSIWSYIIVPIQTMRSSFITITPEVIYNGIYEVRLFQFDYDSEQVQALYDDYVTNGIYNGYVLDY